MTSASPLADQSSLQSKLQQALAECKSLHGELGDSQLEHNCPKCQLEAAVLEKNRAQGQVNMFKTKYDRMKGQHSKAQAGQLLGAQQQNTQLADIQVAQSVSASSSQPTKPTVTGPWTLHSQQQQRPNSPNSDRNSPQGPLVHPPGTHTSASMVGEDPPVMGAAQQQQRPHMKEATGPWKAAQHAQQQQRPNSHKMDRNSPQGPPVRSSAVHNSSSQTHNAPQQRPSKRTSHLYRGGQKKQEHR